MEGTGVDLAQLGQGSYAPAMTMARRGYGCRLSTPVVRGTGVDLAQLGQGSCAPARAIGTARLNRFRHGRTDVLPARAFFERKAQPKVQHAARRCQDCQKRRLPLFPKKAAPFLTLASEARS